MILYAIRHKPTGHFLPDLRRQRAGHTHSEPTPGCIPRLFAEVWHAKSALNFWLKGKHRVHWFSSSWESPIEDDFEFVADPVPSRKAEDMEIVVLNLLEHRIYS